MTDGQGSATAKATYDRARALAKALPPGPAVGRAVFGLWTYYLFQGLMGPTAELADEAVALTERSPDPGVRIMAHLAVSQTHMWTGRWDRSVEHFERVLELYEPERHEQYVTQYAQNPRFTASNSGFWSEWMRGNPETAEAVAEVAIAEAKALDHEFSYTIAFLGRPLVAWFRRRFEAFQSSTDDYVATATRSGNPFYIAFSLSLDASAKVLRGDVDEGLAQLEAQYRTMGELGSKLVDPLIVSLLAEGYLLADRAEKAAALLDDTMPSFERDGRVSFVPDHLRLRAEAMLRLDPAATDAALALLDRAIAVAREHGARSFELRSALRAARILRDLGRDDEGRALVAARLRRLHPGLRRPRPRRGPRLARLSPTASPTTGGVTMGLVAARQGHGGTPRPPGRPHLRPAAPAVQRARQREARGRRAVRLRARRRPVRQFAMKNKVAVTCRSGGHGAEGYCSVDGELMIDQSAMQQVRVDTENNVVHVGAGATWGQVDIATYPRGLATPGGGCVEVGRGGADPGRRLRADRADPRPDPRQPALGPDRHVARREGDRRRRQANEPELFWAIRGGGGGNFGAITEFTYTALSDRPGAARRDAHLHVGARPSRCSSSTASG